MDRRDFLKSSGLGALCAASAGALGGCAAGLAGSFRTVPYERAGNALVVSRASLGDAAGAVLRAPSEGELPIFLHRTADGTYTAVSTRCTHRGCEVAPAGERLVCPCHGSEFTLAGAVLEGPADEPLQSYRVTADATSVAVQLL